MQDDIDTEATPSSDRLPFVYRMDPDNTALLIVPRGSSWDEQARRREFRKGWLMVNASQYTVAEMAPMFGVGYSTMWSMLQRMGLSAKGRREQQQEEKPLPPRENSATSLMRQMKSFNDAAARNASGVPHVETRYLEGR